MHRDFRLSFDDILEAIHQIRTYMEDRTKTLLQGTGKHRTPSSETLRPSVRRQEIFPSKY